MENGTKCFTNKVKAGISAERMYNANQREKVKKNMSPKKRITASFLLRPLIESNLIIH